MPFATHIVDDLPVIIITYEGQVSAAELLASQQKIVAFAEQVNRPYVYAILDVERAKTTFVDVFANVREFGMERRAAGPLNGIEVVLIFVGTTGLLDVTIQLFSNVQQRQGGFSIMRLRTVEEALAYVRRSQSQPDVESNTVTSE
jgi:hypothetical protein